MRFSFSSLPAINAVLNATSALCLAAGYGMIRRKRVKAHAACMVAAVTVSLLFLASYLTYHAHAGSTRFPAQGWIRPFYFAMLTTHTVLAMAVACWLAPVTLVRAVRRRFESHRKIARWTLPIWWYVSATGVLTYFMLYHWYVSR